jgi:glycosyltransferase involved in cell wall biosynthesis
MHVALVHDWLPLFSGAEQVLAEIMRASGPSDLYTLFDFLSPEDRERIGAKQVFTSYLNRLPLCDRYYRWTFPLCPMAIESFDLSAYDLVITSSAAFAKGVITHPHQRHIAYIHTNVRYAWDQTFEYMSNTSVSRSPLQPLLLMLLHKLRIWDCRTANGADVLLANSSTVKRRIEQVYGRRAFVLPPPVNLEEFPLCVDKDDYFVVASRLVPYKRIDLIVDAFAQMPTRKLLVLGDGPDRANLMSRATPNVTFRGHVSRKELIKLIGAASAFIFSAYEDFGIVMVEAQATGTPVIAFRRGGASDIVVPKGGPSQQTGILFAYQSAACIQQAVEDFTTTQKAISPYACRENAKRFSANSFRDQFKQIIAYTMSPDFSRRPEVLSEYSQSSLREGIDGRAARGEVVA